MADIKIKDVTALERVHNIKEGDTLLVVRANSDGTQTCYRADGLQFKGKDGQDAYTIAKAQGFTGTYAEWVEQIATVSNTSVGFDGETGEIIIKS